MKKIMFDDEFGLTKAVLNGRKTQTRRIFACNHISLIDDCEFTDRYSFYKVGETVAIAQRYKDCGPAKNDESIKYYPAWVNKMFVRADLMPHHIKIERVRVERLQDISDEDCIKDGVYRISKGRYKVDGLKFIGCDPKTVYAELIDKICGKGTWRSNPFVFVYDFKLID